MLLIEELENDLLLTNCEQVERYLKVHKKMYGVHIFLYISGYIEVKPIGGCFQITDTL